MKIYRKAQTSSIMYYVDNEHNGIMLSPDPSLADHHSSKVPAFVLKPGKYYNPPSLYVDLDDKTIGKLRHKGFRGIILGELMFVFDPDALKSIGEYDFSRQIIS